MNIESKWTNRIKLYYDKTFVIPQMIDRIDKNIQMYKDGIVSDASFYDYLERVMTWRLQLINEEIEDTEWE